MEKRDDIENLRNAGDSYHEIAMTLGTTADAVRNYFYRKHKEETDIGINVQEITEDLTPEEEIKILQQKLQAMNHKIKTAEVDKNLDLAFARSITVPKYFVPVREYTVDGSEIGVVLISDIHDGMHLDTQINQYDTKIAEQRFLYYIERVNHIFSKYYPHIKQLKVFMLGDIVDGKDIYAGQEYETIPIDEQIIHAPLMMANGLSQLKLPFEVWTIDGNHGRISKGSIGHNWDRVVYYLVERMLPDVKFHIGTDFYQMIDIYNHKFLIMHGEDITNSKNPPTFIERAVGEYSRVFRKYNIYFDYMVMGHFHQPYRLPSAIVNGSICGATTFTQKKIKDAGLPAQVMFIVNADWGVVDDRFIALNKEV